MEQDGAIVIEVDGSTRPLAKPDGDGAWLKALQEAVAGYIELVGVPGHPTMCMLVNEEGLWQNLAFNYYASMIAGQRIVGAAVLLLRALMN
jgi:hypothetical protein